MRSIATLVLLALVAGCKPKDEDGDDPPNNHRQAG